ncbi:MAG TPA: hypothetical protein VL069_15950 [Opitutus sp.]|nr:hypothetical protein [Opitutus sp.]
MKTEIREHPRGGYTLAVPASKSVDTTVRHYAGQFDTEEAAAFALNPVRRPRWRQLAFRLLRSAKPTPQST